MSGIICIIPSNGCYKCSSHTEKRSQLVWVITFFHEHKQFPSSSVHILQHQCNHSCQGSLTSFRVYFSFNFFPCFHSVEFFFFFFLKGSKPKPVLQFCGQIHCNNRSLCLDIIISIAEIRDLHQDLEVWCFVLLFCFFFLTESKFQIIVSLIQGSASALRS